MNLEEIKRRMFTGELYSCASEELANEQLLALDKLFSYNQLPPSQSEKKQELLEEMFESIGKNCYIETPFHANWGGKNVTFGDNVYANFNLTLVDDGKITVGNNVMFAPNVVLCTATHPIDPTLREKVVQYNLTVTIEDNVWLGAGVTVLPGVTIGKNTVVGAGSLVTKDLPSNVVAVGSPCKVLREISVNDQHFYEKNREIVDEF